jgi:Asp/Glu/hydantoin racemase
LGATVVLIHNSQVLLDPLKRICEKHLKDEQVINIMDESLLRDIKTIGRVDDRGVRRICRYVLSAEDLGADVAMMTCSSLSETVDVARNLVRIPVLKIDEPMAIEAVEKGQRIGVLGTLGSVLDPCSRLIQTKASEKGKQIEIEKRLCQKAFDMLMAGDTAGHDSELLDNIDQLAGRNDVVVLAQGSMFRILEKLDSSRGVPVIGCLDAGVRQIRSLLGGANV